MSRSIVPSLFLASANRLKADLFNTLYPTLFDNCPVTCYVVALDARARAVLLDAHREE